VAFGEPAPSGDFLVDTIARAERFAQSLMDRANAQVRDHLTVAADDDIFFHRSAVKVLLDPVSGALLGVARWPWREGEDWDWARWIAEWPALRLFISDLCTDPVGAVPLVNAARVEKVAHQGDAFHERAWWTEEVFEPRSRREQYRAQGALLMWDGATRVKGPAPPRERGDGGGGRGSTGTGPRRTSTTRCAWRSCSCACSNRFRPRASCGATRASRTCSLSLRGRRARCRRSSRCGSAGTSIDIGRAGVPSACCGTTSP